MKTGRVRFKHFLDKVLVCTICGHSMIVNRMPSRNRSAGHIKHMYCPKCKRTTAHEEQP